MSSRTVPPSAVGDIVAAVSEWPEVDVGDHRFGGHEFRLRDREFGHVHESGMVDVPYSRPVRNALVDAGRTGPHHLFPESGWTTFYVRDEADVARAIDLLRVSYLYHAFALGQRPGGAALVEGVDLEAEFDALDAPADLREILAPMYERARGCRGCVAVRLTPVPAVPPSFSARRASYPPPPSLSSSSTR